MWNLPPVSIHWLKLFIFQIISSIQYTLFALGGALVLAALVDHFMTGTESKVESEKEMKNIENEKKKNNEKKPYNPYEKELWITVH